MKNFDINLKFLQKVTVKEKAFMARQLATMLASGLTLEKALQVISNQTKNPLLKQTIEGVKADLEAGSTFSSAISKYPKVFDKVFVNIVISGEAVGRLAEVLDRLAGQIEAQSDFISKIKGALLYPAFILIAMIIIAIIMMIKVVPELQSVFAETGAQLPWTTQALISLSDSMINFWWVYLLVLILIVLGVRYFLKTDMGQYWLSKIEIGIPGGLGKDIYMARFTRTLGMLVGSGTPILEALNITADAMNNKIYAEKLKSAASQVERGVPLSVPIENSGVFPLIVPQMIAVGEQTGKLDESLEQLAKYYEEESSDQIKNLSSLFEPVLIVIIGLGVAFLVFSILLPIYQVAQLQ